MNTEVPAYNYKCLNGNGMKKEINDNNNNKKKTSQVYPTTTNQ